LIEEFKKEAAEEGEEDQEGDLQLMDVS